MKHLPNILTLSRIPLMFVIVALLCLNVPSGDTFALLLFGVAALSDWLDGYLARKYAVISNFGKLMDALTDKIIMVGLFVTLLTQPWQDNDTILPRWCVLLVMVIICREFSKPFCRWFQYFCCSARALAQVIGLCFGRIFCRMSMCFISNPRRSGCAIWDCGLLWRRSP